MVQTNHTQMNNTTTTLTHTPDGNYDYRGVVLSSREDNGYHDSYFYSTVWDLDTNSVKEVMTGATAFAGGWYVQPNALPVVKEVAEESLRIAALERAAANARKDAVNSNTWKKGDTFTVVRGRKIPKGTVVTLLSVREPEMNPWSRTKEYTVLVRWYTNKNRFAHDVIKEQYLVMTEDCVARREEAAIAALPDADTLARYATLCEQARVAVATHRKHYSA